MLPPVSCIRKKGEIGEIHRHGEVIDGYSRLHSRVLQARRAQITTVRRKQPLGRPLYNNY